MGKITNFDEEVVHGTDQRYGKLRPDGTYFTDYNYSPMIVMIKDKLKMSYTLRKIRYENLLTFNFKFTKDLYLGLRSNDVLELQKRFVKEGLAAYTPTGFFGTLTLASAKAYQVKYGIVPAWGYVGSKTRMVLNSTTSASPIPFHLDELN